MTHTLKASIAGALAMALVAGAALAQPPAGGGRGARFMQACSADVQKFCPNAHIGPGGGLRDCMKTNYKGLSDSCRAFVDQMQQRAELRRQQREQQGVGAPH